MVAERYNTRRKFINLRNLYQNLFSPLFSIYLQASESKMAAFGTVVKMQGTTNLFFPSAHEMVLTMIITWNVRIF